MREPIKYKTKITTKCVRCKKEFTYFLKGNTKLFCNYCADIARDATGYSYDKWFRDLDLRKSWETK